MSLSKKIILNKKTYEIPNPAIMGILNLTPDSFSDGGIWNAKGFERAIELHKDGANILDIGAESTRPGSDFISIEEELERLSCIFPLLDNPKFLISVDTNKIEVQEKVLSLGAPIINDILGGNKELFLLCEKYQAGIVIMHTPAPPKIMQQHTAYKKDIVLEIRDFFEKKSEELKNYKIPIVWMDPGIGFGKTPQQNLEIMANLSYLQSESWNLLLGSSRKSWIGKIFEAPVHERLGASVSSVLYALSQGVNVFRVHDVKETNQAINTWKILEKHTKKHMDQILLKKIRVQTLIGVLPEECEMVQELFLDLDLDCDFSSVCKSDCIKEGIDYTKILESIREFCKKSQAKTLEYFADHLCQFLFDQFPFQKIDLCVEKPKYANELQLQSICVQVTRTRSVSESFCL